jgi:hypothetical protein
MTPEPISALPCLDDYTSGFWYLCNLRGNASEMRFLAQFV